jgi:hypothetical protein
VVNQSISPNNSPIKRSISAISPINSNIDSNGSSNVDSMTNTNMTKVDVVSDIQQQQQQQQNGTQNKRVRSV